MMGLALTIKALRHINWPFFAPNLGLVTLRAMSSIAWQGLRFSKKSHSERLLGPASEPFCSCEFFKLQWYVYLQALFRFIFTVTRPHVMH